MTPTQKPGESVEAEALKDATYWAEHGNGPIKRVSAAYLRAVEREKALREAVSLYVENAWELAAPVVVAANRYVEAQAEGNPALIEDAHFQLLRSLTDYKAQSDPEGKED